MSTRITKCKRCNGNGLIRRDECATCKGSGRVTITEDAAGNKTVAPAPPEQP